MALRIRRTIKRNLSLFIIIYVYCTFQYLNYFSLCLLEIRVSHSQPWNPCPNLFWSHEKLGLWISWIIWPSWKTLIQLIFPLNVKHLWANIIPFWKPRTERLIKQVSNKHSKRDRKNYSEWIMYKHFKIYMEGKILDIRDVTKV